MIVLPKTLVEKQRSASPRVAATVGLVAAALFFGATFTVILVGPAGLARATADVWAAYQDAARAMTEPRDHFQRN